MTPVINKKREKEKAMSKNFLSTAIDFHWTCPAGNPRRGDCAGENQRGGNEETERERERERERLIYQSVAAAAAAAAPFPLRFRRIEILSPQRKRAIFGISGEGV